MIRWGIIGAGNIANRFVKALAYQEDAVLQAVACRTMEKAQAFVDKYPCQSIYDNYLTLVEDPCVDAIYIAVPHAYHYEWAKQALEHHKAVLCEKPAMMNAKQMKEIKEIALANDTFFMEAMKSRFVPMYQKIKELIYQGTIGDITKMSVSWCNISPFKEGAYHYQPGQGGCLLDLGVYNANYLAQYLQEPITVKEVENTYYENGIELYTRAIMDFNGKTAILESAFDRKKENQAIIEGTKGTIIVKQFHRPTDIEVITDDHSKAYHLEYENDDFYSQIKHVHQCLNEGKKQSAVMSLDDSIYMIGIIDAIKEKMEACK